MKDRLYQRYQAFMDSIEQDAEYRMLEQKCQALLSQWTAVLSQLPQEQQEVLTAFIGSCTELSERALELAFWAIEDSRKPFSP